MRHEQRVKSVRRWAYVAAGTLLLAITVGWAQQKTAPARIRVLLLTGDNNHKWRETTPQLRSILEDNGRFEVRVTEEKGVVETDAMKRYDVLLLNYNRKERWPAKEEQALLDYVRGGKGLVVIHAANNAFPGWDEYDRMIGGAWRATASHDNYGPFRVTLKHKDHPVLQGLDDFDTTDELYFGLTMQSGYTVLGTAMSKKKNAEYPMIWVLPYGQGRVFHTTLGHDVASMQNPGFMKLVVNGTAWAAGK